MTLDRFQRILEEQLIILHDHSKHTTKEECLENGKIIGQIANSLINLKCLIRADKI